MRRVCQRHFNHDRVRTDCVDDEEKQQRRRNRRHFYNRMLLLAFLSVLATLVAGAEEDNAFMITAGTGREAMKRLKIETRDV